MLVRDAIVSVHLATISALFPQYFISFLALLLPFDCISTCLPHSDIPDSTEYNQLKEELDKMDEQRARYMKNEDYDGIRSMYTQDAMYFSDKIRPGIGIEGEIHVFFCYRIIHEPMIIKNKCIHRFKLLHKNVKDSATSS